MTTMTVRSRRFAVLAAALLVGGLAVACGGDGRAGGDASPAPVPPAGSPAAPGSPEPRHPTPRPDPPAPSPQPPAPAPTTAPAPPLPPALLGQDIERIPTSRRIVALTFDAGANADGVAPILAVLASERVSGTFFLTGDFVRMFPQASRSIVAAGHRLANHSVNHPHFPALSDAEIRDQLRGAQQEIRATAGADPRPLFRFPFGDRDARTIGAVNDHGYVAVRWTVDTLGWQGTRAGRTAAEVTSRVLDTARPGQIVLMHVGSHPTDRSTLDADALPAVIAGLRELGYQFVTLDALLTG
jgi:peptidoglycan/xylan/chitin deacetylase (PgdA/CDA1 family)